jgi:hypothetical protein
VGRAFTTPLAQADLGEVLDVTILPVLPLQTAKRVKRAKFLKDEDDAEGHFFPNDAEASRHTIYCDYSLRTISSGSKGVEMGRACEARNTARCGRAWRLPVEQRQPKEECCVVP